MFEDRLKLSDAKLCIDVGVDPSLRFDLFYHAKAGSSRKIRSDLSEYEINVLEKVKRLMQVIPQIVPQMKAVFSAGQYAAFLEGTVAEYNTIHLFGCCFGFMGYPSNLGENLQTYLENEVSCVKTTEQGRYTVYDAEVFPPHLEEIFTVKFNDGVYLKFQYFELYSPDFSFEGEWLNMFSCFCFDDFCKFNQVGLLLFKSNFLLFRKECIQQSDASFHKLKNFGNPFGLGYLCFKSLAWWHDFLEDENSEDVQTNAVI